MTGYIKVIYIYICVYIKIRRRCVFLTCGISDVSFLEATNPVLHCVNLWILWLSWVSRLLVLEWAGTGHCWKLPAGWISLWERCFLLWMLLGQNNKEINCPDKIPIGCSGAKDFLVLFVSFVVCLILELDPLAGVSWSSMLKEGDPENFWRRFLQPQPQDFYYSAFVQTRHRKHVCLYYIKIAW